MSKTFEEQRPTPVTVIGWAWIILGSFMLLSATGALITYFAGPKPDLSALPDDAPFAGLWRYFWVVAAGQVLLATLGVVAGRRFLKLEKWARGALELASWILLAGLLGFAILWVLNVNAMSAGAGDGFEIGFMAAGVISTLIYGSPVAVMIYFLRSDRVRQAVR
jgi:hypothetical protein